MTANGGISKASTKEIANCQVGLFPIRTLAHTKSGANQRKTTIEIYKNTNASFAIVSNT